MEVLAHKQPDQIDYERLKARDDVVTQFAELVDGSMLTSFELTYDGKELYGRDRRSMDEVTRESLEEAEEFTDKNPNLGWELRRRRLERVEYELAVKMAKGELPNTMVIPSDFPPELMDADEDMGGYNVTRKQTMNRVLVLKPNGNVQMYTQSLDGSDRQALEAIYDHFGETPEEGELLGQRIHVDLPTDEQDTLIHKLTGIYDRAMTDQYGGEWHAGRRPADYRNTYDFVCQQRDIVDSCVDLHLAGRLNAQKMYNMAAAMQKRFANDKADNVVSIIPRTQTYNQQALEREILYAGLQARKEGKSFSACGETLKAEQLKEDSLEEAGFGNKVDAANSPWHGGKKYKNAQCNSCKEVKQEVGACHICEDCVKDPKRGTLRTIQHKLNPKGASKKPESKELAPVISLQEKRRAKAEKIAKMALRTP